MRLAVAFLLLLSTVACVSVGGPSPMPANAGTVRFGSAIDTATLSLVGPEKNVFSPTDRMAYVATFIEPANAASLRLVIAKLDGAGERLLVDEPIPVSDPSFQVIANEIELPTLTPFLDGSGTYVMRFLRDATPLAQGAFAIT